MDKFNEVLKRLPVTKLAVIFLRGLSTAELVRQTLEGII